MHMMTNTFADSIVAYNVHRDTDIGDMNWSLSSFSDSSLTVSYTSRCEYV